MCCDNISTAYGEPNGVCETCGCETVDGEAADICGFGDFDTACEECGYVACHGAC